MKKFLFVFALMLINEAAGSSSKSTTDWFGSKIWDLKDAGNKNTIQSVIKEIIFLNY